MRKLIAFDEETWQGLRQLERDRMATLQELADEAFADLLKKHGVPRDLRDALRRSAAAGTARDLQHGGKKLTASLKRRAVKSKSSAKRTHRTPLRAPRSHHA